ncbi:MAG: adenylosuccinate synthase [Candidatus Aquicultor primus]|uniref:Adenylosuccinate synthetase n=1 Tax=Candidatus Aquicultor primus TaxID=1797195 RepID=A0A1F2UNP6_9ACTN|nr:MAG: adenylosuccinate synthase [Candidatus Aquicultor primus]HCG98880.1 adenylosuccinate synthase [Actinomycetota bacterium]
MPATILIGTQWGDEGKGKVTDWLANDMDLVVRYQGGHNAGHTVIADGHELKLHLLPSGILHPNIISIIASGLVIDPKALIKELDEVAEIGIGSPNLVLSANAHLIMPYHRLLDQASELKLGSSKIGTTGLGIGPAYTDKASRVGLRVQDLLDMKIFREKLEVALIFKNQVLTKIYDAEPLDVDEIVDEYKGYAERLNGIIGDASRIINDSLDEGKNVLLEGAQGMMLDLDYGTYPFVTSSSPIAGGACVGAGISPLRVKRIIGIAKAYTTRVGAGPFPTELEDATGELMRKVGVEFGTTTGRPRRCGWFDAVILKYTAKINGLTEIALTKLDVLSPFETLKICVGYEYEGKVYDYMPCHQTVFHGAKPVYEEVEGWNTDISDIATYDALPKAARAYVDRLQELIGAPITMISVGPSRDQTILR